MNAMSASFNPRLQRQSADARNDFRYRLARLLLLEQFDQALQEAEIAFDQQNILPEDLRFVRDIVEDAKKQNPSQEQNAEEAADFPASDFSTESNRHDHTT
jgi:hypothetical protein